MKRFFDRNLTEELGLGAAAEITAIAQQLHTFIELVNARRKSAGQPTIEEDEQQARNDIRELMDGGHRFDPALEAWARKSHVGEAEHRCDRKRDRRCADALE
jgi:hypothetical protein